MAQQERPRRRRAPDLAKFGTFAAVREWLGELREDTGLAWDLFWDPRVPFGPKLWPVAAAIYILLPVDLWPLVPLDDLAALRLALDAFFDGVDPVLLEEHRTRRRHARQLRQAAETRRREEQWRARH